VDRGQHSLETITLLLALKVVITKIRDMETMLFCCFFLKCVSDCTIQVEYPHNVHLIRGNHEAADINALFGFRIECIERMVRVLFFLSILCSFICLHSILCLRKYCFPTKG